jgi:hypothetical protein
MSQKFIQNCKLRRTEIEGIKRSAIGMMTCVIECEPEALSEARSNVKIAFRHLEDARMRFGKAIQAADGGTSVYDKPDRQLHQNVSTLPSGDTPTSVPEGEVAVMNETGGESDVDLGTDPGGE